MQGQMPNVKFKSEMFNITQNEYTIVFYSFVMVQ